MVEVFSFQMRGRKKKIGWKTNGQASQWPVSQLSPRAIVSLSSRNSQYVWGGRGREELVPPSLDWAAVSWLDLVDAKFRDAKSSLEKYEGEIDTFKITASPNFYS